MNSHRRSNLNVPERRLQTAPPKKQPAVKTGIAHDAVPNQTNSKRMLQDKRLIGAGLLVLSIGGLLTMTMSSVNNSANADVNSTAALPSYSTVLPSGKTIEELGGWQRVSPEDKDPVFAYSDLIGATRISVSQQPLPSNLSGDGGNHVAELAKRFSATRRLSIAGGNAYLGTSAKGPQSVLLAKGNTLILIKSADGIEDQAWVAYIDSLGLSY